MADEELFLAPQRALYLSREEVVEEVKMWNVEVWDVSVECVCVV